MKVIIILLITVLFLVAIVGAIAIFKLGRIYTMNVMLAKRPLDHKAPTHILALGGVPV